MASITTLITDVQQLLSTKGWFTDALAKEHAHSVALRLQEQFTDRPHRGLRLSGLGPKCPRHLWYSVHHPELAEPFPPWAENKFSFGHMIEAWAITTAKAAGHTVTGEQDAVYLDDIKGHRDCIIDGCLVDVKGVSGRQFLKFKTKSLATEDTFGYLDQLDAYLVASVADPLLQVKDKAYDWAVHKELGHQCLYEHRLREDHIKERIRSYKEIVRQLSPPPCSCGIVEEGKSGNRKLDTRASYSAWKYCCFPYLRTFLYANGPIYLTTVVRKPDVTEIDKFGRIVYNG